MEENKIYRPILKKALNITWKFKSLWFLGFFAALISSGGEFELLSRIFLNPINNEPMTKGVINSFKMGLENSLPSGGNLWTNIWNLIMSAPVNLIATVLVLLVMIIIAFFIIWLIVVSQAGLIRNTDLASQGKSATINEGIDAGLASFWPILIVNFIYKIILLVIFIILGKEILLLVSLGSWGIIIHISLLVLFSFITIIISFIVRYQIFYIVLRKEKIITALKSAWQLFTGNWLISLEMAFLLFLIYMVVLYTVTFATAILLALPLVVATYPLSIPIFVIMALALTSVILILIITILATSLLSVFQWSSWILLFNQISGSKTLSKLVKLSEQSPNLTNIFKKK